MKQLRHISSLVLLLILAFQAKAQEASIGYNPFVPVNLDDPGKLDTVPVVGSSYHRYSIVGDAKYKEASTFVWYVENGTMGTYFADNDAWLRFFTTPIGNGAFIERPGTTDTLNFNTSEVWVRWDNVSSNTTGYIAVYERSSNDCIVENKLSGYKHTIMLAPEAWLMRDSLRLCSDDMFSVTVQFNELHEVSFPYKLKYTYPLPNGQLDSTLLEVYETDLVNGQLTLDFAGVNDLDVKKDEPYTIELKYLRDKHGARGNIAPLGENGEQYSNIHITIVHLPQTGGMAAD